MQLTQRDQQGDSSDWTWQPWETSSYKNCLLCLRNFISNLIGSCFWVFCFFTWHWVTLEEMDTTQILQVNCYYTLIHHSCLPLFIVCLLISFLSLCYFYFYGTDSLYPSVFPHRITTFFSRWPNSSSDQFFPELLQECSMFLPIQSIIQWTEICPILRMFLCVWKYSQRFKGIKAQNVQQILTRFFS